MTLSMLLHAAILIRANDPDSADTHPVGPLHLVLQTDPEHPTGQQNDKAVRKAGEASSELPVTPEAIQTEPSAASPGNTPIRVAKQTAALQQPVADKTAARPTRQQRISGNALEIELRGQLSRAMLPYFDYPLLARRRGWEGIVRVGLRVEADGTLSDVHMVEASRHPVLDRAAVESLEQVTHLPNAGSLLAGRYLELILPVEYRLLDS